MKGDSARGASARRLGRRAELAASLALILKGWRILARGESARRGTGVGEIDLIAKRRGLLIFVEVKARRSLDEAAAAIAGNQRRRLVRAAGVYLARNPALAGCDARFDAILVAPGRWPVHIASAWQDEAWRVRG